MSHLLTTAHSRIPTRSGHCLNKTGTEQLVKFTAMSAASRSVTLHVVVPVPLVNNSDVRNVV